MFWLLREITINSDGWVVLFLILFCPRLRSPDENNEDNDELQGTADLEVSLVSGCPICLS